MTLIMNPSLGQRRLKRSRALHVLVIYVAYVHM